MSDYMAKLQSIISPSEEIEEHYIVNGREIVGEYKHIVVAGDMNSNTIYITMNTTYDGVDRSEKKIEIIFTTPDGYTGIREPKVTVSGSTMRLAWKLEKEEARLPGTIEFSIRITSDNYEWKTLSATFEVEKAHSVLSTDIPEIERDWVSKCLENSESALTLSTNNANSIAFLSAKIQSIFATCAIENKIAGITVGMTVSGLFPFKTFSWSVHLDEKVLASGLGPEDEFVTAPVILQNEGIIVKFQTGNAEIVTELEIINQIGNTAWGILNFIKFT